MKKRIPFFLFAVTIFLSGCSAGVTGSGSSSQADTSTEESTTLFSSAASEEDSSSSSYSDDNEYVSFPSDLKKYESYVRKRSEWSYIDSDYLNGYARLPAPSSLYGCSYASNTDNAVGYSMSDWDSIAAYFCLIKSEGFEYKEIGSKNDITLYNIYDNSGETLTTCGMSETSSSPVLLFSN